MLQRMRRRVAEHEKCLRDIKETTERIESKNPMGYGDFPENDGSNGGSSDNGSGYASSECDSDSESELGDSDSGTSSEDDSDSENEQ